MVPVIDLAGLEGLGRAAIAKEIVRASELFGFFQVVNHGVSPNLMNKVRSVSRDFFHLSHEEKSGYAKTPENVQGYGYRNMDSGENKLTLAANDYFYFLIPVSRRREDLWPRNPPEFRETMRQYATEARVLAERLLDVMSEALGLSQTILREKLAGPSGEPVNTIRANFYVPVQSGDDLVALGTHSDPGGITLLLQDDEAPGTQIKINDQWITVQPASNGFCVNVGDQIEILSNGRYKSIEHRGLGDRDRERITIPFFYNPAFESIIAPLDELVDESHPALYAPASYEHYFFNVFMKRGVGAGKQYIQETRV
ncbi:hypothetical protein R1sor_021059 [Riccia sorocarpa]|uniref:Fe2OG dioxygenase domain-containing protein n=1 Tax=Riccia sorocarpa TaxID=122646 RepID=A0ABD3GFY8_9MARC